VGRPNKYEDCKTAAELADALQSRLARGFVDTAEIESVKTIAMLRGWSLSSKRPEIIKPPVPAPRTASEIVAAQSPCITDHMYLANNILGMESPDEHEVLYSLFPQRRPGIIAPDPIPNRLILWSRGLGKSTADGVDIVQAILHDQNVRVLYLTGDDDLAANRLTQVARVFDDPTEEFARTFPELCGLEQRTTHQLIVKGRANRISVDPTLLVSTPGQDTTGSRWDLIILDDLVTFKNSRTEAGLNKAHEIYRTLRAQRSADARIIITGTCYDPNDAYARIQKAVAVEGSKNWLVDVRSCWATRCRRCGHKDLFHWANGCSRNCTCTMFDSDGIRVPIIDRFVTRYGDAIGYTTEWLESERGEAGIGPINFSRQYENDARESAGKTLPEFTDDVLDKFFGRTRRD